MAKIPELYCECCQAEWYSAQISERNYEAAMWRCPACGDWAPMDGVGGDEEVYGPSLTLSDRDRNVIVAALHFFALRFPGSNYSKQLLGILELASQGGSLPTQDELNDLCERIHPACSHVT